MAALILSACPRCGRGWFNELDPVPYHERPPFEEEREDGIGARPCGGSFAPPRFLPSTPPATQPE